MFLTTVRNSGYYFNYGSVSDIGRHFVRRTTVQLFDDPVKTKFDHLVQVLTQRFLSLRFLQISGNFNVSGTRIQFSEILMCNFKVDRENHFYRPGFLHII